MHILLTGNFPVGGDTVEEYFDNVLDYNGPTFDNAEWQLISTEAIDFQQMHWFLSRGISTAEALKERKECDVDVLDALDKYSESSERRKKILNTLVKGFKADGLERLNDMFLEIDKDKTGLIT
jgi:hypothetical protein